MRVIVTIIIFLMQFCHGSVRFALIRSPVANIYPSHDAKARTAQALHGECVLLRSAVTDEGRVQVDLLDQLIPVDRWGGCYQYLNGWVDQDELLSVDADHKDARCGAVVMPRALLRKIDEPLSVVPSETLFLGSLLYDVMPSAEASHVGVGLLNSKVFKCARSNLLLHDDGGRVDDEADFITTLKSIMRMIVGAEVDCTSRIISLASYPKRAPSVELVIHLVARAYGKHLVPSAHALRNQFKTLCSWEDRRAGMLLFKRCVCMGAPLSTYVLVDKNTAVGEQERDGKVVLYSLDILREYGLTKGAFFASDDLRCAASGREHQMFFELRDFDIFAKRLAIASPWHV